MKKIIILLTVLFGVILLAGCANPQEKRLSGRDDQKKSEYDPSWKSLAKHQPPEWLLDAKFGIYTHWGVYSTPAYKTAWYGRKMYQKGSDVNKQHVRTYGKPSEFGYKDFIPKWKAEQYDPSRWAELIKQSGAKYAGLAVGHHDGFLLWDSKVSRWNVANMGPRRDLYGELIRELRKKNLKTIATFHHIRTYNWYLPGTNGFGQIQNKEQAYEVKDNGWDLADPKYKGLYPNEVAGVTYKDFLQQWQKKVDEVIQNYKPDVIWFDGGKFRGAVRGKYVKEVLSSYYNSALTWGKQVDVLNKLPVSGIFNFPRQVGMLTFEQGRSQASHVDFPWIDDLAIGSTWAYTQGERFKKSDEIISDLIKWTAKGGGVLLSLSPKADGTISEAQVTALKGVGKWLDANGEAIYKTRPWKIHSDREEGAKNNIYFTRSKDKKTLYAIVMHRPKGRKVRILHLGKQIKIAEEGIETVGLLGSDENISWNRNAFGLYVKLPQAWDANGVPFVLKLRVENPLDIP